MIKYLSNWLIKFLNPEPEVKTYYIQYCELCPYLHCFFQNVELIKLDNRRAICAETKKVIPFDGLVIVEVRLP